MLQSGHFSLHVSVKTISERVGGPSQGPEAEHEQAGMPHTVCKGLAVGTDSYLYMFTIVMRWSVKLDYVLLGRQQSRSMPLGLMLSALCYHLLDHQTWLLKLYCSSPRPCINACLGLCTEPVDLLSHLQHGVYVGLLGSRVVWSGTRLWGVLFCCLILGCLFS